jgi:plastocyanin domain-containing protein
MDSRWVKASLAVSFLAVGCVQKAKAVEPAPAKPMAQVAPLPASAKPGDTRHVKVGVTEAGFEPSEIQAKTGENLVLDITRVTDETCATAIVIPDQKLKVELPLNKEVQVAVKAGKAGRIAFACPMNMITGAIVVKD